MPVLEIWHFLTSGKKRERYSQTESEREVGGDAGRRLLTLLCLSCRFLYGDLHHYSKQANHFQDFN